LRPGITTVTCLALGTLETLQSNSLRTLKTDVTLRTCGSGAALGACVTLETLRSLSSLGANVTLKALETLESDESLEAV